MTFGLKILKTFQADEIVKYIWKSKEKLNLAGFPIPFRDSVDLIAFNLLYQAERIDL